MPRRTRRHRRVSIRTDLDVEELAIIVSVGVLIDTLFTRTPLVQRCRSMPVVASGGPGRLGIASVDRNEAALAMSGSRP